MAEVKQMLNKVLERIASDHDFVNYDLKIEPVCSGGANYTSTLYNITITEGSDAHHLFAKTAALGKKQRERAPRVYYTEIFVYTELVKVYERLQEQHQVPQEHRLALSKFYGCNPKIYEETIVLENLAKKGYQACDIFKSIDWEYAASAVKEMAKMHALSFAYRQYNSKDFNKVINYLKFQWNMENESFVEYINTVTVRAIETVYENTRDMLKRFFKMFGPEKYWILFSAIHPVLVHGDFRPSNLMHKIRDDGAIDIKIIDLQTMVGGSPIVDLLYLIFTGSDEQFRTQYFQKLIVHYYTELEAAMKRFHLIPEKVYSRADFEYELKEKLPFGLTIAVLTMPNITPIASEDAPKANENLDTARFFMKKTSDLYSVWLNGIVNDYVKWGILN